MRLPAEVIERKTWLHTSGARASICGAVPWTSASDKSAWSIVTEGYTVAWADGTVGVPTLPSGSTREQAQAVIDRLMARMEAGRRLYSKA